MAKLGMREEGVLQENVFARGEWWSSAQSSILSSEWDAVAKPSRHRRVPTSAITGDLSRLTSRRRTPLLAHSGPVGVDANATPRIRPEST